MLQHLRRLSKSDININFDVHLFYWAKVRIPFVNNVYKAAQLARDMLAHVYILLIFPLCTSTKNLYEKYNIIDTDALPPLQKYSRGNLKIYFADTENCISYLHIRGKRYFFCSISDEEYLLLAIKIVRSYKSTLRYSWVE